MFNITSKQLEFFWSKVIKNYSNGCWECSLSTSRGYPRLHIASSFIKAHRLSWVIHKGEIPEGLYVCHTCDNPKCVNPEHLFLGTHQDNMDDMHTKGRGALHFKNFEIQSKATELARSETSKAKRLNTYKEIEHQKGSKNSNYGNMWITNGIINMLLKKENSIPEGWYKGRVLPS